MDRGAEQSEAAELRRPLQHLEICDSDLPLSLSHPFVALSSFVRRIIQRRAAAAAAAKWRFGIDTFAWSSSVDGSRRPCLVHFW